MSEQDTTHDADLDDSAFLAAEEGAGDHDDADDFEPGHDDDASEAGGEGEGEGDGPKRARAPATPEELEKRWRDSTRLYKQEQRQRRALEQRLANVERGLQQPGQGADPQGGGVSDDDLLAVLATDESDDPMADIAALKRVAREILQERHGQAQANRLAQQQQTAVREISTRFSEYERDFAADHPDYIDAAKHFAEARKEELAATGVPADRLDDALRQDLLGVVARVLASEGDPAETIYNLAKRRGFGVDTVAKKLQGVQRSQTQNRSLSATGGNRGSGPLDLQTVNDLSGPAFLKAAREFDKLARKGGRRRA